MHNNKKKEQADEIDQKLKEKKKKAERREVKKKAKENKNSMDKLSYDKIKFQNIFEHANSDKVEQQVSISSTFYELLL
jgi:hypothetical protein